MTKDEVVLQSLWQVTVYAAFQRAKIYLNNPTATQRSELKLSLRNAIEAKVPHYNQPVSEEQHIQNILDIAAQVNALYAPILIQNSIPIGVVQKAFNLYLKLLWCSDRIPEPPHCPLDKVIIDKLRWKDRRSWTKIREIEDYRKLIDLLRKLCDDNQSLADWELEKYERPDA